MIDIIDVKEPRERLPYAQELIRCKDCRKFLTAECFVAYIQNQTLTIIEEREDFFCGYAERRDEE